MFNLPDWEKNLYFMLRTDFCEVFKVVFTFYYEALGFPG